MRRFIAPFCFQLLKMWPKSLFLHPFKNNSCLGFQRAVVSPLLYIYKPTCIWGWGVGTQGQPFSTGGGGVWQILSGGQGLQKKTQNNDDLQYVSIKNENYVSFGS
jgi:hypothetical protein